jgi:hypothetical protein
VASANVSVSARRAITIEPIGVEPPSYARALRALTDDGVPFLVGGGLALAAYCGIRRSTKDLDVFALPGDVPRVLGALAAAGFQCAIPFPHWLAKANDADGSFIDVIFNSGNGAAPVDREWFANATPARVFGVEVAICPAEETIWSKAFVMERERFDGADITHLLLACGRALDWERLVRRFGEHWRVLLSHLVLFGYVYPEDADRVPPQVLNALVDRLRAELPEAIGCREGGAEHLCRGTLLSREQYLPDLSRGCRDARLPPTGTMSPDAIELWTDAIRRR